MTEPDDDVQPAMLQNVDAFAALAQDFGVLYKKGCAPAKQTA